MPDKEKIYKKVSQLILAQMNIKDMDKEQAQSFLSNTGIGGVIYTTSGEESIKEIVECTSFVQQAVSSASYDNLQAWSGVNLCGEKPQCFGAPFTQVPSAQQCGLLNSPKSSFELAFILAKEFSSVGINLVLGPGLQLAFEDDPRQSKFSFGSDSQLVSSIGSAFVRGFQKGGVFSVAKPFPDINGPSAIKDQKVEGPFKKIIRSRVSGIMMSWDCCSELDETHAATFSRKIIEKTLREEMRFQKLVFSAPLGLATLLGRYELKDAAFQALEAGCDQLVLQASFSEVEEVCHHLTQAFYDRILDRDILDEKFNKIVELKKEYLEPQLPVEVSLAEAIVGAPDFQKVSESVFKNEPVREGPSSNLKKKAQ